MSTKPDVRLLDAVTVRHGPVDFLSRFFLEAYQYIRSRGVRLTVSRDFDALARLNEREVAAGTWYPLVRAFDTRFGDISADNGYWVAGINEQGEVVTSQCGRFYEWPDSCLADHMEQLIYGDYAMGEPCYVTAPIATTIRGRVLFNGGAWIHPAYRRHGIASIAAKVGRLFGTANWGADWIVGTLQKDKYDLGMHRHYGFSQISFALRLPGSPWGDDDIGITFQNPMELLGEAELFIKKHAERRPAAA
ncbi:MAG: hypothetical protein ACK4QW_16750 [Alphaproteobacteria bacterium]